MPKTYPVRNSFNAGEVSELVNFRDDIQKYSSSCRTLENAVPLVEGGAKKMPGTYFAGATARGGSMFTGSIAGTTLTVSAVNYGVLQVGQTVVGDGVLPGTTITDAEIPSETSYTPGSQTVPEAYSYVGQGDWEYVGNQFRTHFEPVTTSLSDLVFSNFGFNIPSNAIVLGVVVSAVTVSQAASSGTISQVALWYKGAAFGTIKTPGSPFLPTDVVRRYGSSVDLWGAGLSPTVVNDPSFGFAMAVNVPDAVRVFIFHPFAATVFYKVPVSTPGVPINGVGTYTVSLSQTVSSERMQTVSNGKSRIVPFQFSTEQGAFIELSAGLLRIWEGATGGSWSIGLALQSPFEANYDPTDPYVLGDVVLVGPYAGFVKYTAGVADPTKGILYVASPYGVTNSYTVPITITTNSSNALSVTKTGSSPNQGISIALANATTSNNAAALIQSAIRSLGSLNGAGQNFIDLSGWTVTPDPVYFAAPWIAAPILPTGTQGTNWNNFSSVGDCVQANQNDEFPLTLAGTWNAAFWAPFDVNSESPIQLATPYAEEYLFALDCSAQSADVLWIFHPKYPPAVVERLGANSWAYSPSLPGQQPGEPAYRGTTDVVKTGYSALGLSITGITKASPCVVTVVATSLVYSGGDRVYLNLISGMVELNQGEFIVGSNPGEQPILNGDGTMNFSLFDPDTGFAVDSSVYQDFTGGGFSVKVVPLFAATGDYPACGTLYQERLCVGGSDNNPTQMNGSVEGDYPDFISDPNEDDYAIQFTLVSNQVNQLLNMIGTPNALLIGTSGGVWVMQGSGGSTSALSQTNVSAAVQTTQGVAALQPQLVNGSAIFVSRSARIVNFLVYSFTTNAWENNDLTRLNRSITIGPDQARSGIAQTAFQVEPYPIFWAVRNDGQLIGLVFNTQDQVYAWFRVDMTRQGGFVESCAVISGADQEDQLAVVVRRTINGVVQRFVEYFMPQELFGQLSNAFFVNSGQQWNGGASVGISGITNASPAVVTAFGNGFTNGMTVQIKGVLGMTQVNQGPTQAYTVANATANSFQLNDAQGNPIDSTAWGAYASGGTVSRVANQVSGVSYLIGNTVVAVGDGALILQPTVVTGDVITFPYYANLITIGNPYKVTIQPTNPVLSSQGATTRGMPQKINRVSLSLYQSMGGQYGDDLDHMYDITYGPGTMLKQPQMSTFDSVVRDADGEWTEESTFFVTQDDPLPFTLRGIVFRLSANQD